MAGKFELKKSDSGKFHFNLKSSNGQIILSSGMYATIDDAKAAITAVQERGAVDANFERKTSSKDEPYFVLNNKEGKMLGKSEMYSSASGMENGVDSVIKNAPEAKIVEAEG